MPTSIAMNRVIHGAVRRDFARLVSALGEVVDGDRSRAQDLARAYGNLTVQLTHHHEGEDRYIWPMLAKAGVDAQLLWTMESEHHAMSNALAQAKASMDAYAVDGSARSASNAREGVLRAQVVVDQHLDHEEKELEPKLVPHLDSPDCHEVEKKLSRQPLGVAGPFFAWVTDGMSEEDRELLRSTVPAPVVLVLSRVFGRSYRRDIAPVWRRPPAQSSDVLLDDH